MTTDNSKEEIKARLRQVQSLPTLPAIVTKLNDMVDDEDVTAVQLGKIIERDQVLTSKLLKMVNSSFFGFPQRISTVSNAIVLLGFNVIKTLIVTSSIFETMQTEDVSLWEHSLGCAAVATVLAKHHGIKNPEEISTAGLIHDLGKIVIKAELPDEYDKIVQMVSAEEIPMREAELEVLGVGHAEIGSWLAKEWNLPDRLTLPIKYHHSPGSAKGEEKLAAIIHFSDILIRAIGFGSGGDPWVPELDHEAWNKIKMGKSEMKNVLDEVEDKLAGLANFTDELTQQSS